MEWQEVEDMAESEDESDDEGGMHLSPIKVIQPLYAYKVLLHIILCPVIIEELITSHPT